MSSSTFVTDSSEDKDDQLIIIVNADGTITVDPETLQKLIANQHHGSNLSVVRVSDGNTSSEEAANDDDGGGPHVNLTVEGFYSGNDPEIQQLSTDVLDPNNEVVDPFSQMEPEHIARLESVLQSEQAKEILGTNLTADNQDLNSMLDMLEGKDEAPAARVVHNDHSYTSAVFQPPAPAPQPTPSSAPPLHRPLTRGGRGRGRGRGVMTRGGTRSVTQPQVVTTTPKVILQSPAKVLSPQKAYIVTQATRRVVTQPMISQQVITEPVGEVVSPQKQQQPQQVVQLQSPSTPRLIQRKLVPKPTQPVLKQQTLHQVLSPQTPGATIVTTQESNLSPSIVKVITPVTLQAVPKKVVSGRGRGRGGGRGGRGGRRSLQSPTSSTSTAGGTPTSTTTPSPSTTPTVVLATSTPPLPATGDEVSAALEAMELSPQEPSSTQTPQAPTKVSEPPPAEPKKKLGQTMVIRKLGAGKSEVVMTTPGKGRQQQVSSPPPSVLQSPPAKPSAKQQAATPKTPPEPSPSPSPRVVGGKEGEEVKKKREKKAPPTPVAGPELFSTPDIIRRVSTDKAPDPPPPPPAPPTPETSVAQHHEPEVKVQVQPTNLPLDVPNFDMEMTPESLLDSIHAEVAAKDDSRLLAEALLLDDLTNDDSEMTYPSKEKVEVLKVIPAQVRTPSPVKVELSPVQNSTNQRVRKLPPIELPTTRSASKKAAASQPAHQVDLPVKIQTQDTTKVANEKEKKPSSAGAIREKRLSNEGKRVSEKKYSLKDEFVSDFEDEIESDQESYNSEDDPHRLWCICKKPHNNRFMICCDGCEEWFHGKCVGVTKSLGQQMEQQGTEWSCPNCKAKKEEDTISVEPTRSVSTKLPPGQQTISSLECIVCKKPARSESNYCSDMCIKKHAFNMISVLRTEIENLQPHTRVIVFEKSSGRLISNDNAPTVSNLADWLTENQTFEVHRRSISDTTHYKRKRDSSPQRVGKKHSQAEVKPLVVKQVVLKQQQISSHLTKQPQVKLVIQTKQPESKVPAKQPTPQPVKSQPSPKQQPQPSSKQQPQPSPKQQPQPLPKPQPHPSPKPQPQPSSKQQTQPSPKQQPQPSPKQQPQQTPNKQQPQPTPKQQPQPTPKQLPQQTPKQQQQPQQSPKQQPQQTPKQQPQQTPKQQPQQTPKQQPQQTPKQQPQIKSPPHSKQVEKDKPHLKQTFLTHKLNQSGTKEIGYSPKQTGTQKQIQIIQAQPLVPPPVLTKEKKTKEKKEDDEEYKPKKIVKAVEKPQPEVRKSSVESRKHSTEKPTPKEDKRRDSTSSKESIEKKKEEKKRERRNTEKSEESSGAVNTIEPFRSYVKRTIQEVLVQRAKQDSMSITSDEIKELVKSIEEELFSSFKEPVRYKSKYRSLFFNIKDPKNLTLYKKILDKDISPEQLVKLSPEELASQELAQWREKEAKHQLEIIKKNELDLIQQAKTVVLKSRKGEEVIETTPRANISEIESALNRTADDWELENAVITDQRNDEEVKQLEKKQKEQSHRDRKKNNSSGRDKKRDRSRSRSHHRRSRSSSRDRDKRKKEKEKEREKEKVIDKTEETLKEIEEVISQHIPQVTTPQQLGGGADSDLSDREPSSTVNISTPPPPDQEKPPVWQGFLNMAEVTKLCSAAYEVSGSCEDLGEELPEQLECVGRIQPDSVWEYVSRMKKAGTKDILVIRFHAEGVEEKMNYLSLYSYLNSRNRMAVIGSICKTVKDFYVLPLASHSPIPQVLLPLDGPGFDDYRTHLLLGIIIRAKKNKKLSAGVSSSTSTISSSVNKTSERSYTPPLPDSGFVDSNSDLPDSGSTTPPLPAFKPFPSGLTPPLPDEDEPYSPGEPYSPEDSQTEEILVNPDIQRNLEEVNKLIDEKYKQIKNLSLAAKTSTDDDTPYSPSSSMSPPAQDGNVSYLNTNVIKLPPNLQDILASIKGTPQPPMDVKSDPIVKAYTSQRMYYEDDEEKEEEVRPSRDPRQRPDPPKLSHLTDTDLMRKAVQIESENFFYPPPPPPVFAPPPPFKPYPPPPPPEKKRKDRRGPPPPMPRDHGPPRDRDLGPPPRDRDLGPPRRKWEGGNHHRGGPHHRGGMRGGRFRGGGGGFGRGGGPFRGGFRPHRPPHRFRGGGGGGGGHRNVQSEWDEEIRNFEQRKARERKRKPSRSPSPRRRSSHSPPRRRARRASSNSS